MWHVRTRTSCVRHQRTRGALRTLLQTLQVWVIVDDKIEEMVRLVKERVIETLNAHTDDMEFHEMEYLAEKLIQKAFQPYVDEWVDIRTRTENYAHGNH